VSGRTFTVAFPPDSTVLEWFEAQSARHGVSVNTLIVAGLAFHIAATETAMPPEQETE
jgi:hypothetical protein